MTNPFTFLTGFLNLTGASKRFLATVLIAVALPLTGCATTEQIEASSLSAWQELKGEQKISTDPAYTSRLARVASRVVTAKGDSPANWEFVVFDSKQLNAFALPGGKVGVYTGIMDLMDNDDQLATVVGHEIAHVTFEHSKQRYNRTQGVGIGVAIAQEAFGAGSIGSTGANILGQYGLLLPFSRTHELEADREGLFYMAKAGYDPRQSIAFWQKMATAKSASGQAVPEFMSTHPNDGTRIDRLQKAINDYEAGNLTGS